MFGRKGSRKVIKQEPGSFPGQRRDGQDSLSFLDGVFTQGQFPSVIKEFVHPGKDPGELLMRCVFKDEREANAAILYLAKCEEFGLVRHKKILLHKLASTVSIKGERIKILLQAVTGIVAPELLGEKEKRKREESG